jgi:hypothetical protein
MCHCELALRDPGVRPSTAWPHTDGEQVQGLPAAWWELELQGEADKWIVFSLPRKNLTPTLPPAP